MVPKCPINSIGIRNPVMCSDGYMYEEKCLAEWISENCTSPINRKFIEFVNVCEITEKCLNEYCDDIEDPYERTNFTYSKEETIIKYYLNMIENDEEIDIIFDKDLLLKLIDKNCNWFRFAGDELKDDKEVVLKAIERRGIFICYASDRFKNDREIVLKAVENDGISILHINDRLKDDREIVLKAVGNQGYSIEHVSDKFKDDREIVLKAAGNRGDAINFISDRLKNDKEVVLKAVGNQGFSIKYASERLRYDESIVLEAVKTNPGVLLDSYDGILINPLIYETACIYNTRNFINKFLSKINLSSEYNKNIITLTCYDSINKMIEELKQ